MTEEKLRLLLVGVVTIGLFILFLTAVGVSIWFSYENREIPAFLTNFMGAAMGYFFGILTSFFGLKG